MDDKLSEIPSQRVVECDLCGEILDISWYCKNCPGSLCNKCQQQHVTAPLFKRHSVVPRTEFVVRLYGPGKITEQCTVHTEKEIITYCNQCQVPCCVTCQVEDHNCHNISTIEDKYLSAQKGLNKYVLELETDIKPQLDDMKKTIQVKEQEVQGAEDQINLFRGELLQTVNISCDSHIETLRESRTKLENYLKLLEEKTLDICVLQDEIGAKIRMGNLDIIEYSPPTKESLMSMISLPKSTISHFVPNRYLLRDFQNKVGKLNSSEINTHDVSPVRSQTDYSSISVDYKSESFDSAIGVSSMTAAGSSMVWVMNWDSDVMYLYDVRGQVVRTVTVTESKGVRDMAITKFGEMIISCFDKALRKVSLNGKVSKLVDTSPFEPKGVCINENENIVVCMSGQRNHNHIAIYSSDGRKKLSEKRGRDSNGRYLIADPYRVVQNGQDLCVVDVGYVVCISQTDDVKWVYDAKKAEEVDEFNPYGICMDRSNNLLIVDFQSSSIHYVCAEGVLKQIKKIKDWIHLRSPQGICVDKCSGLVMLGDINRKIVVLNPK